MVRRRIGNGRNARRLLAVAAAGAGGIGGTAVFWAPAAVAGPPYLTDDPEPVAYRHWEIYTFATKDQTRGTNTVLGPALEVNNGVAPNTQLHLVLPETFFSQGGAPGARGLGDVEAGVKYRFLGETGSRPEIGTFPLVELPSGDQVRGLGNGRAWFKIPLWVQKDWGAWTTYGGGGYAVNSAPGQRDYWYGGWLIQRALTPRLTLGGEVFLQGATANQPGGSSGEQSSGGQAAGTRSTAIWNAGGQFNFTPGFSLLFTAGHSFAGDSNGILYVGLYRTFGPGAP